MSIRISKIIFNELLFNIINWQNKQRFWIWEVHGFNINWLFDAIDHEILLKKMGCIGFSEKVISRFESYLSGRAFKVKIDKKFSDPWNLTCGVPHGSMLGPLLFLLYVNDMPQAVKCDLFLYADDTCLTFQHEKVKQIEDQLNLNFSSFCDWFIDNKLSIHLGEDRLSPFFLELNLTLNELNR